MFRVSQGWICRPCLTTTELDTRASDGPPRIGLISFGDEHSISYLISRDLGNVPVFEGQRRWLTDHIHSMNLELKYYVIGDSQVAELNEVLRLVQNVHVEKTPDDAKLGISTGIFY
jgi:hypothetical protein